MSFVRLAPEQHDTIPDIAEPSEHGMLVGHHDAARHLADAYASGRLHHALLLAGPAGIGKATLAFRLAYHLLANPDPAAAPRDGLVQPSTATPLFRQIAQGSHPAVLHLTRPLNERTKGFRSVVTVEEIRRVNRFLGMTAHDGGYRVAIVDPADDMNTSAANALLKNLEEPPSRTLFILISHSPGALLPTIRSRCQVIKLKPLTDDDLLSVMRGLGAELPDGAEGEAVLAARAGGSVREALMLTQFGGLEIAEAIAGVIAAPRFPVAQALRVAEAVAGRDGAVAFSIFNQTVLDAIAADAARTATEGNPGGANRLSELWSETARAIGETETYNLDKKQHVMGLLRRMHQAMARMPA
jgi:DNA polymerase-3 subunit delta'